MFQGACSPLAYVLSWCGTFIVSCYVFVYIPGSIFFVDVCSALYATVFISKEMRVFVHMFTYRQLNAVTPVNGIYPYGGGRITLTFLFTT